ncbi:hypothetical protein [Candidatus Neptunochlamydia vexilliferae]|uniref:Uncharacterized protein n=1 Tax=Candidatus Neptunichlamydia vexilliferae TaxID=1651774 RepID=A0ABS0AYX8_9BACT|nr:hypothetical protein [Candidatus Neptunochlamydia vexilliferae]MBF5059330.1 hypothetical protein [Candidatus Neptunochlamydia vexilliferae]
MSQKVSEAHLLFRLEHKYNKNLPMSDLSKVTDYTTVKVHHLVPNIPYNWTSSAQSSSLREIMSVPLQGEDIVLDFMVAHLIDRTLKNIRRIVREDLASYLSLAPWNELKTAHRKRKAYEFLRNRFEVFQMVTLDNFGQIENEIHSIRLDLLDKVPLSSLLKEGKAVKQGPWDPLGLAEIIQKHLLLMIRLNHFQFDRLKQQLSFPKAIKEKIGISPDQKSVMLIQPQSPPQLGAQQPFGSSRTQARESEQEFQSVVKESKRLGVKFDPQNLKKELIEVGKDSLSQAKKSVVKGGMKILNKELNKVLKDPGSFDLSSSAKELKKGGVKLLKTTLSKEKKRVTGEVIGSIAQSLGLVAGLKAGSISSIALQIDLSGRRFKRLQKSIKKLEKVVRQSHAILMGQLVKMEKGILALSENQQIIDKKLTEAMRFMELHRRELLSSLAEVSYDSVLSRLAHNAASDEPGMFCRGVRRRMERDPLFSPYFNRFMSYTAFSKFYSIEKDELRKGLDHLPNRFLQPGKNDVAFVINGKMDEEGKLFFDHYRDLWSYSSGTFKEWDRKKMFEFLMHPLAEVDRLDKAREHFLKEGSKDGKLPLPDWIEDILYFAPIDTQFTLPYDIEKLLDYGKSAHAFHYFYEFMKDRAGGPLIPLQELESHQPSSQGLRLLQNAFFRVCVGIAQANLLMGAHSIPQLYQDLKKKNRQGTLSLIGSNAFLAQNMMIYGFRKAIKEKKRELTDYYFAYSNHQTAAPLKQLLGDQWDFVWSQEAQSWGVRFVKNKYPISIPKPLSIMKGLLIPHPYLLDLFNLRRLLLREIAGYHPIDFKPKDKGVEQSYYLGILLTSIYFRNHIQSGENYGSVHRSRL